MSHFEGGKFLHCLVLRSLGGGALQKNLISNAALIWGQLSIGGGSQLSKYGILIYTLDSAYEKFNVRINVEFQSFYSTGLVE
jgi:hypothetical protein